MKAVAYLFSATVIAQSIPFLLSPILTRLYSPESFGLFGSIAAIISIITVASTFRYELAILIPDDDDDAASLLCVAILFSFFSSIITALILFLVPNITGIEETGLKISLIIPFGVFISSMVICLNYFLNRKKMYKQMSFAKILNAVNVGSTQLVLGVISSSFSK